MKKGALFLSTQLYNLISLILEEGEIFLCNGWIEFRDKSALFVTVFDISRIK